MGARLWSTTSHTKRLAHVALASCARDVRDWQRRQYAAEIRAQHALVTRLSKIVLIIVVVTTVLVRSVEVNKCKDLLIPLPTGNGAVYGSKNFET